MRFERQTLENTKTPKEDAPLVSRREFLRKLGKVFLGATATTILLRFQKEAEALEHEKEKNIKDHYQDWQELKKLVDENRVAETIQWAHKKFGSAASSFLYKPSFDMFAIESLKAREEQENDFRKTKSGKEWLEAISKDYHWLWNASSIETRLKAREKREGLSAEILGFDKLPWLGNENLRRQLEQKFNRRWLYGNISFFRYIDSPKKRAHYGVAGDIEGGGLQSVLTKGKHQIVNIYHHQGINPEGLIKTIAHEIGHHQDWEHNNRLPISERLQFLREITQRFESQNRWHTQYIDIDIPREYREKGGEIGEVLYRQVKEYWATIVELYTTDIDTLRTSPEDFALVEKWYHRIIKE